GCWGCDKDNGEISAGSQVKPSLKECVLSCPDGYALEYTVNESPGPPFVVVVSRLYRYIGGRYAQIPERALYGSWYDTEKKE
ncbi:hypothetical protein PMAYCL1PPCAC_10825, partial [Pristionchus mayeri]